MSIWDHLSANKKRSPNQTKIHAIRIVKKWKKTKNITYFLFLLILSSNFLSPLEKLLMNIYKSPVTERMIKL